MLDSLRNKASSLFKKQESPLAKATKPTALSNLSSIYSSVDFGRYNPDDLIGRRGFAIYKKMMLDEQVKAAVKFKRDATTSRGYTFELDQEESGLSEEEVKNRIYLSEQYLKKMEGSFMDVLNYIMSAQWNGFSYTEMIFEQIEVKKKTWWGVNRFKLRPFDTIYFDTDEFGDVRKVIQKVSGSDIKIDPRKFVHFVVNPDIDEQYGQSDLREAYRAYFNKDIIIKFRNIWLERHAGGFTVVQPKEGKTLNVNSAEYVAVKNIIDNLATSTGIVLPSDYTMDNHSPANNVAFKEAIEDNDMAIARAILIPNLLGISPQGKHGSQSQAGTQFESFLWTLEADARRLEEALNEQVFRLLAKVNFGDEWYPRFKFKPVSESKKFELLGLWKDLVSSGAVTHTETDEEHIRKMIDFPDAGEEIINPEKGKGAPNKENDLDDPDKVKVKPNKDEGGDPDEDDPTLEETVRGRGIVTVSAFSKAQKRVDFAVIADTSEAVVSESSVDVAAHIAFMTGELLTSIEHSDLFTNNPTTKDIKKLKFNSKSITQLRNEIKNTLSDAWSIGEKHARKEINKSKGKLFSIDQKNLNFIGREYFDVRSFAIAGKLSNDAQASIQNIILNGVKGGKTFAAVEMEIYESLIRDGYMTLGQSPQVLQPVLASNADIAAGTSINIPHRVNTIVRTSSFDAINQARYNYFSDPLLDGFVEAMEYSAILDARTTQICTHLDGKVHDIDSATWQSYMPPNHFNCRSLLIPVTQEDVWTESDEPTLDPQRGF